MTTCRIALVTMALGLAAAVPARAQDGPIASARPVTVDAQIREYLDAPPPPLKAVTEPLGAIDAEPARARALHGEVGVGIGTGGYRHVHAAVAAPVGETGTVTIAVSETRFNGRGGPHERQSLSVGVALGDGTQAPRRACADGVRARDLQPGAGRMRGAGLAPGVTCGPDGPP